MATPTLEVTPPVQSAPSMAKSVAQSISPEELKREIAPKQTVEKVTPPEVKEAPKQEAPRPDGSPKVPDFKSALRKQVMEPEPKKEEPAPKKKEEAKKEEPKAEEKKDEPLPKEQLRVLPHDKPDTARRIKQLWSEKESAEKTASELRAEIEALKKQAPTQANTEELTKLKQELAAVSDEAMRLRRRYDWENDAEVKSKYYEPVKHTEEGIKATLKKQGYSDATLKVIEDEGGFAEFSRSRRAYPVSVIGEDGEKKTEYRTGAELALGWLANMPVADAEEIKASLGRQQLLRAEEKAARADAEAKAKQYFESRNAAQQQAAQQAQASAENAKKEFDSWLTKTESETDFLKDKTVPDNASAEERKSVEEYNAFTKQLRENLRKHPTTTAEYSALKLDAAEAHHLRRVNDSQAEEIESLKAQLAKAKAGLKTTPSGGSLMTKTKPPAQKPDNKNPTDFLSGLRSTMAKATGSVDED